MESAKSVWQALRIVEEAYALAHKWSESSFYKAFLVVLNMNEAMVRYNNVLI